MSLEYDEAVCSDAECLHHTPPGRADVLYPQSFNVAPGYIDLSYAGGLGEESLANFQAMGNRVSQCTVRLDCIEPQTGAPVQMTFVIPTMMAHHLGMELAGAAWHHSATADDVWTPQQAEPDGEGVRLAAAFFEDEENGDADE